jgi:hypothetical protein
MKTTTTLLLGALALALSSHALSAPPAPKPGSSKPGSAKVYRWTDDKGQVHYGTALPPSEAGRASQTLNASGRVIESREGALTPEQLAERAAAAEAAKIEEKKNEEQRKSDGRLRMYATADDLRRAHKEAIHAEQIAIDQMRSERDRLLNSWNELLKFSASGQVPAGSTIEKKNVERLEKLASDMESMNRRIYRAETALFAKGKQQQEEVARYFIITRNPVPEAPSAAPASEPPSQ